MRVLRCVLKFEDVMNACIKKLTVFTFYEACKHLWKSSYGMETTNYMSGIRTHVLNNIIIIIINMGSKNSLIHLSAQKRSPMFNKKCKLPWLDGGTAIPIEDGSYCTITHVLTFIFFSIQLITKSLRGHSISTFAF